ncbi:hypothetical protein SADUNF_Sadunf03G0088500 [Salix dunnii]|uniref:Uncharacterized protein n=1 Tax=Salix dunnii TaxID=1413687 RepID=A0A835K9S8_9ROSI|nr:hypothetical protein SADUNF_Sadunf03G0088500 [Salix dunnii]
MSSKFVKNPRATVTTEIPESSGLLAGTSLTIHVPLESCKTEDLDFFTNRQQKPDGFSPKTLKKEQTRKSGLNRERPREISKNCGSKPEEYCRGRGEADDVEATVAFQERLRC